MADLTQGIFFFSMGGGRTKLAANGQYRIDPLLASQDELYRQRGDEYLAQGQFDLAIADYSKAIDVNPANGDAYFARGSALLSKGSSALADQDSGPSGPASGAGPRAAVAADWSGRIVSHGRWREKGVFLPLRV